MLFNSFFFLCVYLPITLGLYFLVFAPRGKKPALGFLALASLFFYAWWNPPYVALILASMLVNYEFGSYLSRASEERRTDLWPHRIATLAVALNLCLLGYYKYANFFLGMAGAVGGFAFSPMAIVLPLGISFFTFEQVSYVVDAYRGQARHYSFIEYAFFVTFFPHLIAGPIIVHTDLLAQVDESRSYRFDAHAVATGLTLFFLGLCKKVLFADNIAPFATQVFAKAEGGHTSSLIASWLGVVAYSLQLYFDFSGYSDMGLGLARILGFKLPLNFDSPYKAQSIIDFWRRWHMTLSRFLREYLYIALGGNRFGLMRRHFNLFMTMFLGGLWHGAGLNFMVWGALHGGYLIINHTWRQYRGKQTPGRLVQEVSHYVTMLAVLVGWVFFRAADSSAALTVLKSMAGSGGIGRLSDIAEGSWAASACGFGYLVVRFFPNSQEILAAHDPALTPVRSPGFPLWKMQILWAPACAGLIIVSVLGLSRVTEFLYFQF